MKNPFFNDKFQRHFLLALNCREMFSSQFAYIHNRVARILLYLLSSIITKIFFFRFVTTMETVTAREVGFVRIVMRLVLEEVWIPDRVVLSAS